MKQVKEFRIYDDVGEMIINNKGYTCYNLDGNVTTYGEFKIHEDAFDLARSYITEIFPDNIDEIFQFLDEIEKI